MIFFRNAPISRKLSLAFIGMSAATVIFASFIFLASNWVTSRHAMENDVSSLSKVIGSNSTAALIFNDPGTATEVLSALSAREHIQLACIYRQDSATNTAFAFYAKDGQHLDCPPRPAESEVVFSLKDLRISSPITLDKEVIGTVYMNQSLEELWNAAVVHLQVICVVIFTSLGFSLIVASVLQRQITRPILNLANTAQNVAASKDYSLRTPTAGNDEVGALVNHFNFMLSEIETRDGEVRLAKVQLQDQVEQTTLAYNEQQQTMQRLKDTQRQLVQTEKMASLGGLVAGVAHEINTPVGVGVTAASTLKSRTKDFQESFENKSLTTTGLKQYIEMATLSSRMILTNLERAAELIRSFKQVAVDQTSAEHREFELAGYLNEVLLSLGPKLKATKHVVEVNCPSGIMVDSYPGAFAQIMTNLIMNTLIHGFEHKEEGKITINVSLKEGEIHLHYEDDGVGVSVENQAKIFDPFYTTKRGFGGSGLGLHVVYNLVTHTLKGHITMNSKPGEFLAYDITFPLLEGLRHEKHA
jgi:signal transduction histidine kinase